MNAKGIERMPRTDAAIALPAGRGADRRQDA
jgi:hypothetical protein